MGDFLKTEVGYVIIKFPTTQYYLKTSFNTELCPVKPGYIYDMETERFVPKSLIQDANVDFTKVEPIQYKTESDSWKLLLLGGSNERV